MCQNLDQYVPTENALDCPLWVLAGNSIIDFFNALFELVTTTIG